MDNYIMGGNLQCELFVTTARTTKVSVKVDSPKCSNPKISASFSITAGQVKQLLFNYKIRMIGSAKGSKGIWVTASDEIVIYGVNKEHYSNDGFVGLPTDVLSDEYYVVTWYPPYRQCELLVVGVEDSTKVTITLGQYMGSRYVSYNRKNYKKGNSISENLNKFDTWQLVTNGDLSGSKITSNKKISVFSGNKKTNIGRGSSQDHLVEHMTPVNTWGKKFATVPIPKRTVGDYFKFIASEDNTRVTISGGYSSSFTISKAGGVVQKLISSKAYCRVVADKPIMLVQFVQSQQSSSEPSDPAMMIIPPCEQYGADYTFSTPKYSAGSYENYFMFIVEEKEASGLRINGKAFPTNTKFQRISGTTLVGGYISIPEGTHTVRHTSPIAIFGGFLYGKAPYETYGFTTGMRMAKVNAICIPTPTVTGDGIDNDCDGKIDEELCTPENKNKDDDGDGKVNEDCAKPPPIDGKWTSWTSYGACSVTCQPTSRRVTGTKTRTRSCSNPAPAYDGKQCDGSGTQTSSCSPTNPCRVDGKWGSWGSYGACSVTCGSGSKSRSRSCNNPAPAGGGSNCAGSSTSTATCTLSACPIDGKWGSWGSYGSCSKTCGGGTQSRSRSCSNPAPRYGGRSCSGSTSSSQSCNTHNCPIDGKWASWGSYGSCTITCGGGTQRRSRTCSNPAPKYLGKDCPGSSSSSRSCNTHNCPIDGFWAGWGSWATCTETCGGGIQTRSRSCSNPTPQYGGAFCSGFSSDTQRCNTQNCPINGAWNSWSRWGSCTVTCGGGTQKRSRSCSSPTPQYGGLDCAGSKQSSQTCNTHHCPIDGGFSNWGSWGTCTVTCGGGTQVRTRSCSNPTPQYGGAPCSGVTSQNQDCNTQVCIIDGAWSTWGAWGSCSVSCGGGKRSRARTCSNPKPANGGKSCSGSLKELGDCNSQFCPTPAAGTYVQVSRAPSGGALSVIVLFQLCPTGWFTCQSGGITCIDKSFVCDCSNDCDDGSDETVGYAGCSGAVIAMCEENGSAALVTSPVLVLFLLMLGLYQML
ncbi:SCO-spondin-like [Saccostrea echinata]|uniref:SCO-spondin-like n=1 Tax=Saccostrea echinata TaxID=191078 RepID=UPI002A839946|nr:SCO-spondin-like [Saccostrea echinata]